VRIKSKETLIPCGAVFGEQTIDEEMVEAIRDYFSVKYGEGEMVRFYVLQSPTEESEWAYYEAELMDILEECYTRIAPPFYEEEK